MSAAVVERLRQLVSDQLGVDVSKMKSEANIIDDLGADSLDVVELVMAIEETFDIEVSDEEAEVLRTVGDVEAFVVGRVAAGGWGAAVGGACGTGFAAACPLPSTRPKGPIVICCPAKTRARPETGSPSRKVPGERFKSSIHHESGCTIRMACRAVTS